MTAQSFLRGTNWTVFFFATCMISALVSTAAVVIRRWLGPIALWVFALIPSAGFTTLFLPELQRPLRDGDRFALSFALLTLVLAFGIAPIATTWMAARRPTPPPPWKQVGLGIASTYAALVGIFSVALLVVLAIRMMHR